MADYNVPVNRIELDKLYKVTGEQTATYAAIPYVTGTTFRGVVGVTTFTYSGSGTQEVVEVPELKGSSFEFEVNDLESSIIYPETTNLQGTGIEVKQTDADIVVLETTIIKGFGIEFLDTNRYITSVVRRRNPGTGGVADEPVIPVINPDAQPFIDAVGLTDPTHIEAISSLVGDLVDAGVWAKMIAVYPFVGGTAETHKWNLVDPRDLDAALRLQFINAPVHDFFGVTWNGTTQYADTFFNPSVHLGVGNSGHMAYYSRIAAPSGNYFMGTHGVANGSAMAMQYSGGIYSDMFQNSAGRIGPVGNGLGLILSSRVAVNDCRVYQNANEVGSKFINDGNGSDYINMNMVIGAQRSSVNVVGRMINAPCSFASLGFGLTPAEAVSYSNAVRAFQMKLGRHVV